MTTTPSGGFETGRDLAAIVNLAAILALDSGFEFALDAAPQPPSEQSLAHLGLTAQQLAEIGAGLPESVADLVGHLTH